MSQLRAVFTMWQMVSDHVEDRLPRVDVPALVVRGGRDAVVSAEWTEQAARVLPRGRLAIIPGGAHALNLNSPVELAQVVQRFLREESGFDSGRFLREESGFDSGELTTGGAPARATQSSLLQPLCVDLAVGSPRRGLLSASGLGPGSPSPWAGFRLGCAAVGRVLHVSEAAIIKDQGGADANRLQRLHLTVLLCRPGSGRPTAPGV